MVTKTITIMEDAYRLMAEEKMPNESFSDLVRRKFKKADLLQFAGAWAGISDKEAEEMKEGIRAVRRGMDADFNKLQEKDNET